MEQRMADNRPIGIFDSGLGGLTAVTCLKELLPEERFLYFGDTARTPYGSKATETLHRFSKEIAAFLLKKDAKAIVIACNTVSATCLEVLREVCGDTPVIGIIEPAARAVAATCTSGERIGVIGTKVTVASRQYERSIRAYNENCAVFSEPCPLFVPAIEEGLTDTALMEQIIGYYMDDFVKENRLDVLVLGCTHYALVEPIIAHRYPQLRLINPSRIVADEVADVLEKRGLLASENAIENRFYASDLSDNFINMTKRIIGIDSAIFRQKNFEED